MQSFFHMVEKILCTCHFYKHATWITGIREDLCMFQQYPTDYIFPFYACNGFEISPHLLEVVCQLYTKCYHCIRLFLNTLIRWLISPRKFCLVCNFELSSQFTGENLDVWKPEMKTLSAFLAFGILNIFRSKHWYWILHVELPYSSSYLWSHPKDVGPSFI